MGKLFPRLILLYIPFLLLAGCHPTASDTPASSQTNHSATPSATLSTITQQPSVPESATNAPDAIETPGDSWAAIPEPTLSTDLSPTTTDAASGEGYIVVYSDTSRAESSIAALMDAHPGLEAETYTLSSLDIYLRLREDLESGSTLPDVYLVGDGPRTQSLLDEGILESVVPTDLEAVLPTEVQQPLLAHHWSAVTLVASRVPTDALAIDNWWDLTRTELRGRVVLPDPIIDERTLYWLTTVAQHGDEMATAYQLEFGQAIVLDTDCPNAGWQWIKDLLRNEPQLVVNDAQVAATVGDLNAAGFVVGLCGSEQWEKVARGEISLDSLTEVQPTAGLRWWSYLALVAGSQRRTAAEEAIRWLMGDAAGGGGYAVWYKAGFYPARSDVPDPPGAPSGTELAAHLWELDIAYLNENLQAVRDFVTPYMGHPVGGH